jgi:hypothetical protein
MNKTLLLLLMTIGLSLLVSGCQNSSAAGPQPSVTTGLTANRSERMQTMVDDLKARGYSEERAKRIAAKEIPVVETTYTESISGVLSGRAAKEKAEKEQFLKEFSKSGARH